MFKRLVLLPIYSLFSRRFYISSVLFKYRGLGVIHYLWVCFLASVAISISLYVKLIDYQEHDLKTMMDNVPSFLINDQWEMEFAPDSEQSGNVHFLIDSKNNKYVIITDKANKPMIVFNPENADISDDYEAPSGLQTPKTLSEMVFTITFFKDRFSVYNGLQNQYFTYKEFMFQRNKVFNSVDLYNSISLTFRMFGLVAIFLMTLLTVLIRQVFYIGFTSVLSFVLQAFLRLRISAQALIRLNVFANTTPLVIFTISMVFVENDVWFAALNNTLISLIPLVYVYLTIREITISLDNAQKMQENKDNWVQVYRENQNMDNRAQTKENEQAPLRNVTQVMSSDKNNDEGSFMA